MNTNCVYSAIWLMQVLLYYAARLLIKVTEIKSNVFDTPQWENLIRNMKTMQSLVI